MNYSYTINKVLPKSEFMSVTYSADGYPDYRRNFNPVEFTQEYLVQLIEGFAPHVVDFWERQVDHPEDFTLEGGSGSAEAPVIEEVDFSHAPTIEPRPAFDPFTQYVTLNEITDPMQETVGWTIHDMTAEEIAEYLAGWRSATSVTMRQARLALLSQNKLTEVTEALSSLPEAEKTAAEIEWEYGSEVRRTSPLVTSLAVALNLTDEELDSLFVLAATL